MESRWRDSLYRKPPFILVASSHSAPAEPDLYRYSSLHFTINTPEASALVIKQNNYPFWHASLNGNQVSIADTAYTFMKLPLVAGKNELEFQFKHPFIKVLLVFQFVLMTLLVILAYRYRNDSIA